MNSVASDAEQRDYLFALWDSLDLGGNVRGSRQRAPLHPGRQPGRDRPGHRAVRPRAPHRLNPAQRRTQTGYDIETEHDLHEEELRQVEVLVPSGAV
jgi:hypothetical protein